MAAVRQAHNVPGVERHPRRVGESCSLAFARVAGRSRGAVTLQLVRRQQNLIQRLL